MTDQRETAREEEVWAVCCSGGGIRSASYCLGALQALQATGFLDKARLILGVSGGGYLAASRALVAHGLEAAAAGGEVAGAGGLPPYAPGSPEEQHLRNNTRYLAPDAKTMLAGVLSLLFGVTATLTLVLTPVFAAAHAWGWLLRSRHVLAYTTAAGGSRPPQWTAALTALSWWAWPALAGTVTFGIFLWWWATLRPGPDGEGRQSQLAVRALGWATFLTVVLTAAVFAVPGVVAWLSSSRSGALRTVLDDLGFGRGAGWTPAAIGGFVAAVITVSQSARSTLTRYNLLKTPEAAPGEAPRPGLAGTVVGYLRGLVLPWLASVLSAYAVIRKTGGTEGQPAPFGTRDRPGALLSQLNEQRQELVLCTTANINACREVPPGRGGLSFSFDPVYATLRGPGPGVSVQARTADYEALAGRSRFTLFDVAAISGAAFSPLMGSATMRAYRILFTATDLRLGVWLPHPAVVDAAARELERQEEAGPRGDRWWPAARLLLWYVLPHPAWRRGSEKAGRREAQLWAHVLKLRRDQSRFRQFRGGLLYHALQPSLGMLYAEAAGHTSYRDTWMCVTDGGHYDNLGLVEALHRAPALGITHILVLDASGDQASTWSTLGGTIALARADASTEIAIDPVTMVTAPPGTAAELRGGQVVSPWAGGTFTRQPPLGDGPENTLVVCKLGWWTGAPWDVRAYAASHPAFPTDSTLEQLYDSAEFDAYRELGACSVRLALRESLLARPVAPSRAEPNRRQPRFPFLASQGQT
ncbi:MAG TPA: hypothetical protein VGD91_02080 [Trebonia sp.]